MISAGPNTERKKKSNWLILSQFDYIFLSVRNILGIVRVSLYNYAERARNLFSLSAQVPVSLIVARFGTDAMIPKW